ncbi:MAG: M23 family metallopeptidase [Treponema sp.]|nr:M23 family metallopeptidase [Treponema sp.]
MRKFIFFITFYFSIFSRGAVIFGEDFHTVKKGETIYSIALSYAVSTEAFMKLNGITDPAKLKAGQKLKIPQKMDAPKANTPEKSASPPKQANPEYVAVKNDTLFGIAKRNGTTVSALLKLNELPSNYLLKTGDRLKIPHEEVHAPFPSKAALEWPVTVKSITKSTGKIAGGVVITSYAAEIVRSVTKGVVQSAGPYLNYRKVVIVKNESGWLYIYGGCEQLSVKQGDKVGAGTELGRLSTDASPQLLFMVDKDGVYVDPAKAPRD